MKVMDTRANEIFRFVPQRGQSSPLATLCSFAVGASRQPDPQEPVSLMWQVLLDFNKMNRLAQTSAQVSLLLLHRPKPYSGESSASTVHPTSHNLAFEPVPASGTPGHLWGVPLPGVMT